jgi:hypothetical protein
MRATILKIATGIAIMTASAAPAMACGGLFGGGATAYAGPCGASYAGYGYAGTDVYERLPDPGRYYYVNQGPSFSGPGNFAPYPTYQETAISGYRGYHRPNYGYYDGGPYGGATNHYSWAQPSDRGPAIYSYRPRARSSYRYGLQHSRFTSARVTHAPRRAAPAQYEYRGPNSRVY